MSSARPWVSLLTFNPSRIAPTPFETEIAPNRYDRTRTRSAMPSKASLRGRRHGRISRGNCRDSHSRKPTERIPNHAEVETNRCRTWLSRPVAELRAYRYGHRQASDAKSMWWTSRLSFGSPCYGSDWWESSANGAVSGINGLHCDGSSPKGRAAGFCQRSQRCFAVV